MTKLAGVLPDTSIWIDHFRTANPALQALLDEKCVLGHPFIHSELALGSLTDRKRTLEYLNSLPCPPVAEQFEIDELIERKRLYSRGIGFVDAHLLASALIDGGLLVWTLDRRLQQISAELKIGFTPSGHHLMPQ